MPLPPPDAIAYFAYGSNLHPVRLRQRAPSAAVVGAAALAGHRLAFHKLGRDGSGKADARDSGDPTDRVWGVIYWISLADRQTLDRCEGLGVGYARHEVDLALRGGGLVRACSYFALDAAIRPGLRPFTWYRDLIVRGARHHQLPADYRATLEAVAADPDPDPERHRRHMAIAARLE